jgi:FlaA1/EpsC-like NDP-sugar epimerase
MNEAGAAAPTSDQTMFRSRVGNWAARHRLFMQAVIDVSAWMTAIVLAVLVRYDFSLAIPWQGVLLILPLAALAQIVAGIASGLYLGRWRFGSFDELAAVAQAVFVSMVALFMIDLYVPALDAPRMIPISATIGGALAALVFMAAARYVWRLILETKSRPVDTTASRMLVFGAGEGGEQVLTAMLRDPESPYLPVALLDDDPRKRNLRMRGVPVVGSREDVAAAATKYDAKTLLIAIPRGSADLISDLNQRARNANLDVKVLPAVNELFGASVGVGDIRDVTEADLLGRHEIDIDISSIAEYLTAKRVMVIGAGGSIGSELCRQAYGFGPEPLVMVDRDESALHTVQLSIEGRALLDSPNVVLADIRDVDRLEEIFAEHKPQVVFHAAALKHLPLLERAPREAVLTNVIGTLNVLEAARRHGVERFVNISSDKAADPASVLGYSKRIGERLTAHYARHGGVFLSVRFGNVLGSRGSMLETFQFQVATGGPITVTHGDVTRYFMTIPEAVRLVIQAGAIGRDGEALVLDMGEPVRIKDVAQRLADNAQRRVNIVYTGLRDGEKLHEVRLSGDEPDERPLHPLISHVAVPPLAPDALESLTGPGVDAATALRRVAQTGTPASSSDER